jgi:fluoride exporter
MEEPAAGGAEVLRIALGGALGTGLRLLAGGLLLSATPPGPLRLLAVNVLGALVLGWVRVRRVVPSAWMPALTTGVLGGFTTFSTMVVQAGALGHGVGAAAAGSARMAGPGLALAGAYLAASVVLGLTGYLLGHSLGRRRGPVPAGGRDGPGA